MSFFVSEALKGRVTEEDLAEEINDNIEEKSSSVIVRANFRGQTKSTRNKFSFAETVETLNLITKTHDFYFDSLLKKGRKHTLCLEVSQSYEFLSDLINSDILFEVISFGDIIGSYNFNKTENDWELIKQNERNCYLLKIIIDA